MYYTKATKIGANKGLGVCKIKGDMEFEYNCSKSNGLERVLLKNPVIFMEKSYKLCYFE